METRNIEGSKKMVILLILLVVFILLILGIFIISRKINTGLVNIQNEEEREQVTEIFLKGGHQIGVVSFNLDKDVNMIGKGDVSGAAPLKDMIKESLAEGKKWDIIGFQEMKESHPEKQRNEKDTADFIQIMQELTQISYNCVKQQEFSNDFFDVICSKYPIVEGSFREHVIWRSSTTDQARVFICVLIDSPAGIIPFCTTHPRAGSNPEAQFLNGAEYVFNTVLDSYIPNNVHQNSRVDYVKSLQARLIVTGDTNSRIPSIQGKLMSVCINTWLGQPLPSKTSKCGGDIDQVMIVNMAYPDFGNQAPFNTQYLVSEGGYKDNTRAWPTDHFGPVVSIISTKDLNVPIKYKVEATPTIIPTLEVSPIEEQLLIDINEDSLVDITDFALFVEYYKVGNVKIDYDEDGRTIRDIDDFMYFIQEYKKNI
ncbi:hypothetical protein KBD45_00485 [Candidatus Dojkabacteria bacterium]|nr:hypothetical protein [Candidatus Dojkabacteria bacterium]